ncbi:hypothetical protein AU210_005470 [Fusarium oxysporum f. sp. radicis-cucumerinum]|uniref:AB hydrolase-1 domain-containing protein n=2 Tax=Fusarium oxysporum TaxID=5507 RepID=A0A2H3HL54_FUSOX|nr:hypothetical protein AU210_005470 [Fusarium oxysporum f. sp. radicis-cucumerinum]
MLPSITASHCKRNPNVDTSDIRNTTYVNFVRSVTIPSGTTYRYVFAPPSDTTKPYLLFIHGFPETSYDWSHQITYFTEQGYGVIVPDLLGCGGTDTPRALTLYGFKNMAADVGQILDCEGVEKVIGVSHDLGSPLLSRFVISQPSRFTAVAFLGNGYFPPAARVDAAGVDFINEAALSRFGYETVGFWSFNNEENAAKVFDQHLESFSTLSFTRNTSLWIDHLAPTGAIRQWLMQDKMATDIFVSRARMEQWKTIIRENGGMDGPLRWYKAMIAGVNNPTEEDSDTMVLERTLKRTISIIAGDPTVGGASSGLTVYNGDDMVVTRLAATVYWAELYLTRSTPACTATSDCQSGPCTAFRLSALSAILMPWYMQKVFGKRMIVNEDRYLTTNLLVRGWGVVFASDVLTVAETPTSVTRWLRQQVR